MNREIVAGGGAGLYPLQGDVQSQAGSSTATVAGIQGTPVIAGTPAGGANLQYDVNTNSWTPTLRAAIQVNGVTASDDPLIAVNKTKSVLVNGS